MQKTKDVSMYVIAYIMWIASFLLWGLFIIMGREVLLAVVRNYYVGTSFNRGLQVSLIDRAYFFSTGLIWLILMVVVEHYFRVGVKKGLLFQRIGKVLTPIVLMIFLSHLGRSALIGFDLLTWKSWLVLGLEIAFIALFVWMALRKRPTPTDKTARVQ